MVIYDEANLLKQQKILGMLLEDNLNGITEFEAQRMIMSKIMEVKNEFNLDSFSISSYVKDTSLNKWKCNPKCESDYFVKIFYNEIKHAKEVYGLTRLETSFLYEISEFLCWETNLLIDDEGSPMNQKMLMTKTGMDKKKVYQCVKSLEQKKCLIRIWDGNSVYYIINPHLMFKGQNIKSGIPKLFAMIGYIPS